MSLREGHAIERDTDNPRLAVGASADNPCIIVALMLARTLGDFIDHQLFAASTALLFEHSRLFVYYRDDRPYKSRIVAMNPYVTRAWAMLEKDTFPFDGFDDRPGAPVGVDEEDWARLGCRSPHILLTPSMMQRAMLPAFPNSARFAIPNDQIRGLDQRLLDAGLRPDRWFCVLHYREPTFGPRGAESDRDIDPSYPIAMTDHIIRHLGGQVVRIGHPGMRAFPARSGFVDLAGEEDPGFLHAHAVSRARFFYELSPSGPAHFAWAFGTPAVRCNAIQGWGPLEESSMVVLKQFRDRSGNQIPLDWIINDEMLVRASTRTYREARGIFLTPNSLDELRRAARDILARTADCLAWRRPVEQVRVPPPNSFEWPLQRGYRHHIMAYWDSSTQDVEGVV